ncbi:MAG TPA: hypothetical protein VGP93_01750, partial [Polyangiaceae bacterium]|nr:hypothetical protein [Polyangiaceae bacterium]
DLSQTPQWLVRCTGVEKLTPGPNAVGTRLRYGYREGARRGTLEGEITARTPNERLSFLYSHTMIEIAIDFRVTGTAEGTRVLHAIDVLPKTFIAKLFAPMIRRQLPTQTMAAMESLRGLVESRA